MLRRDFLGAALAAAAPAPVRPPNIVVVLCDDLGYGDLASYGHPIIRTPNFDRFAAQGMRFNDAYAASPVCSPSRAGLLTGRVPDRAGIFNWIPLTPSPMHLRREEITFPKLLQQAGYKTCLAGKWHLGGDLANPNGLPTPGDHGFDHWFAAGAYLTPSQKDPDSFVRNGKPLGPLRGFASTLTVDEAVNWLRDVKPADPFCLCLTFHAPHERIASADHFVRMYANRPHQRGEDEYWANVTELDAEFGRLLRYIDDRGQRGNTLVVFTSDNGPETLGRHQDAWRSHGSAGQLRSRKLSLYEGGIRVPCAIRWPDRIKAGQDTSEPISSVDFLPTICAAAGLPLPDRPLDGASLMPLFSGRSLRRRVPLHWHYYNALDRPKAALRDGDWKILGIPAQPCPRDPGGFIANEDLNYVFNPELAAFELYNLAADPGERRNLAASEPRRLRDLSLQLVRLHREVVANAPRWNFAA